MGLKVVDHEKAKLCRQDYDEARPHSSLGYLRPIEYINTLQGFA